jgi:putative hemolysin
VELIIIFVLVLFNGVLAMSEAAVISARKARLQQDADDDKFGASVALELTENPNRFLSTVQIGITLVGVLSGAFGGAAVADDIAVQVAKIDALAPYSDVLGLALIVGLTTYLSLIIGELAPKRIAIENPERIASLVAPAMHRLSQLTFPIVWFLSLSTNAVLRLIGIQPSGEPAVTEDEVRVMLREGTRIGTFALREREMVQGVFRMDDMTAASVMTPRTATHWLDVEASNDDIRQLLTEADHALYPVINKTADEVVGVVRVLDLVRALWIDETFDLRTMSDPPLLVPETLPLPDVFNRIRNSRLQLAVVIGEYGGVEGIVTTNDIVESIVGDIDRPDIVARGENAWLIDGLLPLEEFKEFFGINENMPDEEHYRTLAGFVVDFLGQVPEVTDRFEWKDYQFEVIDMDGHRVDKVLVGRQPTETEQ